MVGVIRTVLLAATVMVLALASRHGGLSELSWAVYPLLVLAGIKLLLEDVRTGDPAMLVVGFAAYGLALIFGPRIIRRRRP